MTRPQRGGTRIACYALAFSAFALIAAPMVLRAQNSTELRPDELPGAPHRSCLEDSVRVALPEQFNARPIRYVDIVTHGPRSLRIVGTAFDGMHARTRIGTVRRELLFAPGDKLDSLSVSESLRQLRTLGFLDDAFLVARTCNGPADADSVDITVVTRDAWSTSASGSAHASGASIGFTERNVLGTGRTLRFGLQGDRNGFNRSIGFRDPALLGSDLIGDLRMSQFSHGASWQAAIVTRRRALIDPWTLEMRASSYDRTQSKLLNSASKRSVASVIVGRRLTSRSAGSAVYFLTGAEMENSRLSSAPNEKIIGPASINRQYAGGLVGMAVLATHFDTLSWLLPSGVIVDVPHGIETQFVVGPGRDPIHHEVAGHLDGWIGMAHTVGSKSVVYSDVWVSGYAGHLNLQQSTLRASISASRSASRGLWTLRITGERMRSPDPDVRALASVDVTSRLLAPGFRLANDAIAASAERSVHLREIIRGSMLDAAVFAAGSLRHEPASASVINGASLPGAGASVNPNGGAGFHAAGSASVLAIGTGLRLLPSRSLRSAIRLDVGMASIKTLGVKNKPYIALSVSPFIGSGRRRDANRLQ